jgi:hypothetical protein
MGASLSALAADNRNRLTGAQLMAQIWALVALLGGKQVFSPAVALLTN